jgi:hypothetical protein
MPPIYCAADAIASAMRPNAGIGDRAAVAALDWVLLDETTLVQLPLCTSQAPAPHADFRKCKRRSQPAKLGIPNFRSTA